LLACNKGAAVVPSSRRATTAGYRYASSSAAAATYAGTQKLDVINMSYFVDGDQLLRSTESNA